MTDSFRYLSQHNVAQCTDDPNPHLYPYKVAVGAKRKFVGYVHALTISDALAIAREWQGSDAEVWA